MISPEGAAGILWRDGARARDAAMAMKITAPDLLELKIIDRIIPEPTASTPSAAWAEGFVNRSATVVWQRSPTF